MHINMFTDGGARGNPGPAASAAVLRSAESGGVVATASKYLGRATNNQAEYVAVIIGLEKARALGARYVSVFLDSELVTKQLNGQYKVKNFDIARRFLEVKNLMCTFDRVTFTHVRREKNKEADALVNKVLDAHRSVSGPR